MEVVERVIRLDNDIRICSDKIVAYAFNSQTNRTYIDVVNGNGEPYSVDGDAANALDEVMRSAGYYVSRVRSTGMRENE